MNIRKIAQLAGVSVTTVSRTMNHPELVNDKTREIVQRVMQEQGYKSNQFAKNIMNPKTKNIGIIVPTLNNTYFVELIDSCRMYLQNKGYMLNVLCTSKSKEVQDWILDFLADKSDQFFMDGLIIAGSAAVSKETIERMKSMISVPIVVIEVVREKMDIDSIYTDDFSGIRLMVNHLKEQHIKSLGVFSPSMEFSHTKRIIKYLKQTTEELGIDMRKEHIIEADNTSVPISTKRAEQFLGKPLPDVIFSFSDMMTLALIKVLRSAGVRIPEDVQIVCGDYSEYCELAQPGLTCIIKPIEEMGRQAGNLLIKRIEEPNRAHEHIILPVSLSIREAV